MAATTARQRQQKTAAAAPTTFAIEEVALADLKPHPRNYLIHPDDEIEHIMQSVREHGLYRNIVISLDGYILAGHGVVQALLRLAWVMAPVRRLSVLHDHPAALKVLVGDNEIRHLAEVDDRALTDLLKEISETDTGLLGVGYDEAMLANLAMVTRPASEIADMDAAAQWAGMPDYEPGDGRIQVVVNFANEEDRQKFCQMLGVEGSTTAGAGSAKSLWWPPQMRHDLSSVRFTDHSGKGARYDD